MSQPNSSSDPSVPSDPNLEKLLLELQAAGDMHSQGTFTLDSARSRLLLERYRLPTPGHFIYHLVAVALVAEPSRLDIQLSRDNIQLTFGGRPFGAEELSSCTSSLFLTSQDLNVIRLQQLAIAMAGATAWGASGFEVHSQPNGINSINVRKNLRLGFLSSVLGLDVATQMHKLLADQQLVSLPNCPIYVNGTLLKNPEPAAGPNQLVWGAHFGRGPRNGNTSPLPGNLASPIYLDCPDLGAGDLQGVVRYYRPQDILEQHGGEHGLLRLIVQGRIYTYKLYGILSRAQIDLYTLQFRKDLSQQSLVQSDVDRLIESLNELPGRLLEELATLWPQLEEENLSPMRAWLLQEWRLNGVELAATPSKRDRLRSLFAQFPLFALVGQKDPVSLAHIRQLGREATEMEHQTVLEYFYTRQNWEHPALDGSSTILAEDPLIRELIEKELVHWARKPARLQENDWALIQAKASQAQRAQFLSKTPEPMSISAECWAKLDLQPEQHQDWCGEIALVKGAGPLAKVCYFLEGRSYLEKSYAPKGGYPNNLLAKVTHPKLQAAPNWIDLQSDSAPPIPRSALVKLIELALNDQTGELPVDLRRAVLAGLILGQSPSALAKAQIFQLATTLPEGGTHPMASYQQLEQQYQELGFLPMSHRLYPFPDPQSQAVVLKESWMDGVIELVFPQIDSVENVLRTQQRRLQSQISWQQSLRQSARLDSNSGGPPIFATISFAQSSQPEFPFTVEGQMGCLLDPSTPSRCHFLVGGLSLGVQLLGPRLPDPQPVEAAKPQTQMAANSHVFAKHQPIGKHSGSFQGLLQKSPATAGPPESSESSTVFPAGLRLVIDCPQLNPNEDFDAPRQDSVYWQVLKFAWQQLDKLAIQIARHASENKAAPTRMTPQTLPLNGESWLVQLFQVLKASGRTVRDLPTELSDLVCLEVVGHERQPLSSLARWQQQGVKVYLIEEDHPPEALVGLPPVLWAQSNVADALRLWLPWLECGDDVYLAALYARQKELQTEEPAEIGVACWAHCDIRTPGGIVGQLGLISEPAKKAGHVEVRLLTENKYLDKLQIPLTEGETPEDQLGAVAVLNIPGLAHPLPVDLSDRLQAILEPALLSLLVGQLQKLTQTEEPEQKLFQVQELLWLMFLSKTRPSLRRPLEKEPIFYAHPGRLVNWPVIKSELDSHQRVFYSLVTRATLPQGLLVLITDRKRLSLLRRILGPNSLADVSKLASEHDRKAAFFARPQTELFLPEREYLAQLELESTSLGYRAKVGLYGDFGLDSRYAVHFQKRWLGTVLVEHPFSIEVALEVDNLEVNSRYTSFERNQHFEQITADIDHQVSQHIRSQLPADYQLKLAILGRKVSGPSQGARESGNLWANLPLICQIGEQPLSLNELMYLADDCKTAKPLYFVTDQNLVSNPELLPNQPVFVLDHSLAALLGQKFQPVDLNSHLPKASQLLEQMPQFPSPRSPVGPLAFSKVEADGSWTYYDATANTAQFHYYWKGRPFKNSTAQYWPGFERHADLKALPLFPNRVLEEHLLAESQTQEEWLSRHWSEHLESCSDQQLHRFLPYVQGNSATAQRLRRRLGLGRYSGLGGQQLKVVAAILAPLEQLHPENEVRLSFDAPSNSSLVEILEDGTVVYYLHTFSKATGSLAPFAVTELWQEYCRITQRQDDPKAHQTLMEVLLQWPHPQ